MRGIWTPHAFVSFLNYSLSVSLLSSSSNKGLLFVPIPGGFYKSSIPAKGFFEADLSRLCTIFLLILQLAFMSCLDQGGHSGLRRKNNC